MKPRYVLNAPDPSQNIDVKINKAVETLQQRCPEEWKVVMNYLKSFAYIEEIAPEMIEKVKSEYHKKALAVKIVRRLEKLEEI